MCAESLAVFIPICGEVVGISDQTLHKVSSQDRMAFWENRDEPNQIPGRSTLPKNASFSQVKVFF